MAISHLSVGCQQVLGSRVMLLLEVSASQLSWLCHLVYILHEAACVSAPKAGTSLLGVRRRFPAARVVQCTALRFGCKPPPRPTVTLRANCMKGITLLAGYAYHKAGIVSIPVMTNGTAC